jgi:DNA-binding transcriptional LysR family regulator
MRLEMISQRLKLRQLRIFLAVGQTGSMARAAKQLATSQSVVSKTIGELEELLGVRLVDRSTHGVELTAYGKVLLARSIAILDDVRAGVNEIETLADPEAGELRIGTTEPQAGIVVRAIEKLSGQYPRIDFKVVVGSGLALIDRELRGRQIDLVLGVMPDPVEEDLEATVLYHNRMRVVVGTKSPWARKSKVTLADLINEPWCAPPSDYVSGAFFREAFHAAGLPTPRVVVSCVANHVCHGLLADGRFVSISSDGPLHFSAHGPPLKVLPIDFPCPPFEISIIMLHERTTMPATRLFIDSAREITKPLTQASTRTRRSS